LMGWQQRFGGFSLKEDKKHIWKPIPNNHRPSWGGKKQENPML
jgi:hypothetical protein